MRIRWIILHDAQRSSPFTFTFNFKVQLMAKDCPTKPFKLAVIHLQSLDNNEDGDQHDENVWCLCVSKKE